jgi:hypothetical protein
VIRILIGYLVVIAFVFSIGFALGATWAWREKDWK